jgi:cbb3-type cytochrome oxidase subunit 3
MTNPASLLLMATSVYVIVMLILAAVFAGGIYIAWRGSGQNQIDQSRRSFLGGRNALNDHALFFGIQLVIQIFGSDQLRARLARLIEAEDETDSADEKRRFMKSVASLLIENQYAWEYGFWEFSADADTAIRSFNQWRNEIEASIATEPEEMGSEIDRLHRFSDQKEYLIVTLLMLIDNRDEPVTDDVGDYQFRPAYSQLALPFRQLCEHFDESEYWRAETFRKLLDGVRAIDPRVIERDGIYVFPGTEQDGLSSFDLLSDEGWKYLTDHSFRLS